MNLVNTLPFSSTSSSSSPYSSTIKWPHRYRHLPIRFSFSSPKRRRSRRKTSTKNDNDGKLVIVPSSDDQNLRLVVDFNQITALASSRLQQYLVYGQDAYLDLTNLIRVDDDRRLVVSCRKSTMEFVGGLAVLGFVVVFVFRVLVRLGSGLRGKFVSKPKVMVRRDRSLGGREVIVGTNTSNRDIRASNYPVSTGRVSERNLSTYRVRFQDKLPKWWLVSVARETSVLNKEVYQREANILVQAIMDNRTGGKDIMEDDIFQLRRICKIAGVQVTIDPTNARDSFYRTTVDFVLNACSRSPYQSTFDQIDDEDAREFVAGLAENIKLDNVSAARMVSAAVAARTRSHFLQAWALEMQGKHSEAVSELSKICHIHRVFPPEKFSAEMEMVARGLEKLMNVQEREFLMRTFVEVCGEESSTSAAEALGLMPNPEMIADHLENRT